MASADNIKSQLQNLLTDRPGVNMTILFAYTPAFNHLHEVLSTTEIIRGYCIGNLARNKKQVKAGKWLIICTNEQLVLLHKGSITDMVHIKIPLSDIIAVVPKFGWLSGNVKIRENDNEWELYNVNKTDLQFFEAAFNTTSAGVKK